MKKKTNFQKYLDKKGSKNAQETTKSEINNTTGVDEDRVNKSTMKSFGRHIKNLQIISEGDEKWFLKGDSPFGDSSFFINKKRNWYCEATNQTGDYVDLLRKLNPLLTEHGAYIAMMAETYNTPDFDGSIILDEDNFMESLNSFREIVKTMDYMGDTIIDVFMKNNFWINDADEYNYMELSRTNKPICRYHWGNSAYAGGNFFLTCGVPRIKEHPKADRIYFVENPVQLIFLKEDVSDPIYIKPTNSMYSLNDYLKLVEGKEIVNYRLDDNHSFEFKNWDYELIDGNNNKAALAFFTNK